MNSTPAAFYQVITVFPDLVESFGQSGVVGQARKKGLLRIETLNPRRFTQDVHQSVDDRPFGGGDGMVMLAEPLAQSIEACRAQRPQARVLSMSPQGKVLTDARVKELARDPDLILLCGRYSGVDQRLIRQYEVEELSIGDYVLSGGEMAAAVLIDAVSRFIPGVLGHGESAERDSFHGGLLEAPLFTRPREIWGRAVPEILLSGHHAKIQDWQQKIAQLVTLKKRPDLLSFKQLPHSERRELLRFYQSLSSQDLDNLGLIGLDLREERESYER